MYNALETNFNPRSPCGERPAGGDVRGIPGPISIHAPRVGSDRVIWRSSWDKLDFNPRSPCGERHHRLDFNRKSE